MEKKVIYIFFLAFMCLVFSCSSQAACSRLVDSRCTQYEAGLIPEACGEKFNIQNAKINFDRSYDCAIHGDAAEIFEIGLDYFNGYPVSTRKKVADQDYVLAYAYFLISAKFGEKRAAGALGMTERWRRSLTGKGEEEARSLAESWRIGDPLPTRSSFYKETHLFTKTNDHTLMVHGHIYFGAYVDFVKAFTPSIDTLVLDSPGGSSADGALIGEMIKDRNITAIVDGECLSSCANYLFIAASKRIVLKDSILGFHGGAKKGAEIDQDYEFIKKEASAVAAERQRELLRRIVVSEFRILDKYKIPHSILDSHLNFMIPPSLEDKLHEENVMMWFPSKEDLSDYNINVSDMWYPLSNSPAYLFNYVKKFEYNIFGVPAIFDKELLMRSE